MTPTEQDKELREKISHRFDSVCAEGHQQSCGEYQTAVDDVMQLITADRKRVALEAKIEESKLIAQLFVGLPTKTMKRTDLKYYLINRIAELKAQQEEA